MQLDGLGGATIIFDLDGTLADTAPDIQDHANAVLATIGQPPLDLAAVRGMIGMGARALLIGAARHGGRELTDTELDMLAELFRQRAEAEPVRRATVYPGVVGALGQLKQAGARLAVCTNKHAPVARAVLAALDLLPWFDGVAGGGDAPANKPDPRHLELAVSRAGGVISRAVMVGDARPDVMAARAAGVPVIVSATGYGTEKAPALGADAIFTHFDEVPGLVQRLLAL